MPRVRGVHRAQRRILSSHSPIPTPTTRPRRSTPKSSRLGASRWSSRPAGCSSPPTLAPVSRPPHSQGAQRLGSCPSQVSGLSPNQFTYPPRSLELGVRGWVASLEYVCQVCRQNLRIPAAAFTNWGSGDGSRDATEPTPPKCQDCRQINRYVSPLRLHVSRLSALAGSPPRGKRSRGLVLSYEMN